MDVLYGMLLAGECLGLFMKKQDQIDQFRKQLEQTYASKQFSCNPNFDEMLCYELHSQPVNPRMRVRTMNDGFHTGLTFRELAQKWGISVAFLGELIADHCRKLEEESQGRRWDDPIDGG